MAKTPIKKLAKRLEELELIDEISLPADEVLYTSIRLPKFRTLSKYLTNTILKKYENSKDIDPNKLIRIDIIPDRNSYIARIYQ